MRQFFKMTLATICGIVIFLVITGFFFVISLVGMIASESASTKVGENSVFVLSLNGIIDERSEEDNPLNALLGQADMSQTGLDDLLTAIRRAKENDDIKGIYIEGGIAEFDSPATAQQLRDALKDFRKSGKWIVAYADQYLQTSYYVASVANNIYMGTNGMIDFKGLGGQRDYYKGLYDKLGIRYQAAKVGKYKSYVESDTRTDMSDYDREQRKAYLTGIWNHWLKDIAGSRNTGTAQLNQLADDSIMIFADPKDYVQAKLVDKLLYPEELRNEIKKRLNLDQDDDISQLTLTDMLNVKPKDKEEGDEIAVYYAYGSIVDNEATGLLNGGGHLIVGKKTAEDLRRLAEDDDVKAVVIRVNSGGGSATASEQIWHAIKQLKTKKPVVVSMGGAAASGGYMISAAANYIFAEPTTITGSIGIFGMIPNVSGLITDKLGITFDGVQTNRYTDYETKLVFAKENAQELKYLQGRVDRGYTSFLRIVAEGRKMKTEEVDSIAQGRVWQATDAVKIGLVDRIGSLDDAIKKAAGLAKLKEYHAATYPGKGNWMDMFLSEDNKGSYLDGQLRAVLGDLYKPLMEIRRDMGNGSRIQTRMLDDIRVR